MAKVTITRREVAEGAGLDGEPLKGVSVTYFTPAFPPRTLFIPGDAVSDAQVAEAIRNDIAGLSSQKPTTMEI